MMEISKGWAWDSLCPSCSAKLVIFSEAEVAEGNCPQCGELLEITREETVTYETVLKQPDVPKKGASDE
tara:strand:+ start:17334 stop:17540 length:207 start_codon:yes stop_codon:yes gene_type:complete